MPQADYKMYENGGGIGGRGLEAMNMMVADPAAVSDGAAGRSFGAVNMASAVDPNTDVQERMVVRTADMSLVVPDVVSTGEAVEAVIDDVKGIVTQKNAYADQSLMVIARVPVAALDEVRPRSIAAPLMRAVRSRWARKPHGCISGDASDWQAGHRIVSIVAGRRRHAALRRPQGAHRHHGADAPATDQAP